MRLFPYTDAVGKLTIGVGRNLTDVGLSRAEAEYLLDNDIARAAGALAARFPWTSTLDEVRRGVLVNMAFNMGIEGLAGFVNTLAAFERHDWEAASRGMLASRWATQVGERATRLAQQVRTGAWV